VCHDFLSDASFYDFLFQVDRDIASKVQQQSCQYCGGCLHSARYPRKPRGRRHCLTADYQTRLSFCCNKEGCRRRTTPPSVRFLGRKVYLGVIIILITALNHGLSHRRRQQLLDQLDINPQTFYRWLTWWREFFPTSRCWQAARSQFMLPLNNVHLPGALLGRFTGRDLAQRLCQFLQLLLPLSTTSWSGYLRVAIDPQKM
jgi:hypothetical protein